MADTQWVPTPYSYSAAVKAGEYVFLGLHHGFGKSFTGQIDGALAEMKETLAGLGLKTLVKLQVWLKNVEDLPQMEKIVAGYFEPGRMTATTQFIDADCLVMIEGIAYTGRGGFDEA